MTQTMLTVTVAWDALYRGVLDHAQLAGQLCSCTSQAREPGTQWMEKNTAPPEGSAAPFFLLQHRHKTPNQTRSILQEGTVSNRAQSPPLVFPPGYILPLGSTLDSGRTRKLYMMTSVYSQRHFVLQGVDRRVRKKALTSCSLAQQFAFWCLYRHYYFIP